MIRLKHWTSWRHRVDKAVAACILAKHDNPSSERAVQSALKFGLEVYLGITHDPATPRSDAHVFPIIWKNDFADARNQLLDRVTNRFVLWLDSDEELFSFPKYDWDRFRENIFYVRTQFNSPFTPRVHIRMHRNHPRIRWVERIHEHIAALDEQLYISRFISSLIIRHHGYEDEDLVQEKHKRNLKIAERGLDKDPLYAEILTQAREETARGKPNFLHWIRCYQTALATSDLRTQPSYFGFEPAFLMCIAGYLAPAKQLLDQNPLNIYLQLALLASTLKYQQKLDEERLSFLEDCLQNGFYDVYENFPKELLGADRGKIINYIQTWLLDWKEVAMNPPVFEETIRYQRSLAVDEQTFDDDILLMNQKVQKVVVVNAVSAVLWQLLETPSSPQEFLSLLQQANPTGSIVEQKASLKALFEELLNAELIVPV